MKKILFVLVLSLISVFIIGSVEAAELPEGGPELGKNPGETDFYSPFHPGHYGSERLDDNKFIISMKSGYGTRGGFRTPFDIRNFEMSLDLTYVDPNVVITTFFGPQGSYIEGNGATLTMEIIKHTTEDHKYLVSIQAGSGTHNVSFEEIRDPDQGEWEDNAWQGYQVVNKDDIINIGLKDEGENSVVTINDKEFNIASNKLYQDVDDKTSTYFLIGALNKDGTVQTITINKILDQKRREYLDEDGVYGTFIANLESLEAILENPNSNDVLRAIDIKNSMNENLLYNFDQMYLSSRLEEVYTSLNTAIANQGPDFILDYLESELSNLESVTEEIKDISTAKQALRLKENILDTLSYVDETSFNEDQLLRLEDLETGLEDVFLLIDDKILEVVSNHVAQYEEAVLELNTIEDINNALKLRNQLNQFLALLNEEEQTAFITLINDAEVIFKNSTSEINENWEVRGNTYTVVNEGGSISASFIGNGLEEKNGLFYTAEQFDVRQFSMVLEPHSITGSWLSFGIMENPKIFSNADDPSVQENKGLFFLIKPDGNNAVVEVYQLSLYSNRFFDAHKIDSDFTIDITEDIEIKIGTELKEISGVSQEYMSIRFGSHKVEGDLITTNAMLTSLEDFMGYLYIASQGSSVNDLTSVTIKLINGKMPTEDSLYKEYIPEPQVTETEFDYILGSNEDLEIGLNTRGEDLNKIIIGNNELDTNNYTYNDKTLVIHSEILEALTEGAETITIVTDGGAVEVTLNVIDESRPNIGLIIGIIIAVIAVGAGVGIYLYIKNKEANE